MLRVPKDAAVSKVKAWWSGLSLDRRFALAAACVIILGMSAIGHWVAARIEHGVVRRSAVAAAAHMDALVAPLLQDLAHHEPLSAAARLALDKLTAELVGKRTASIKIWRPDGVVIYSNWTSVVGRRMAPTPKFSKALKGEIAAEFEGPPHAEDNDEIRHASGPLLEVYAPLYAKDQKEVIAVGEYYLIERDLAEELDSAVAATWLVVGTVGLLMMAALSVIVRAGSRTIQEQRQLLQHQITELENLVAQKSDLEDQIRRAHRRSTEINERLLRRVGADLHDGVAQLLSMALLLMPDAAKPSSDTNGDSRMARVRPAILEALRDIRNISSGLMLPEIGSADLEQVVHFAVQMHMRRTGTQVECDASLPGLEASQGIKVCVYRFIQEALNNAYKHAGGKGQRVTATMTETLVEVTVSDHGPGLREVSAGSSHSGLGITGMRDRIETLGGELLMASTTRGLKLTARFDLASLEGLSDRYGQ